MKKLALIATIAAAVSFSACNSNANKATIIEEEQTVTGEAVAPSQLQGEWTVVKIYKDAEDVIEPANVDELVPTTIVFAPDNTFGISTNCNSIGGTYTVKGDSLKFDNMFSTRMACPDMSIEEALNVILPDVKTVEVGTDDSATLKTADSRYVQLQKRVVTEDEAAAAE